MSTVLKIVLNDFKNASRDRREITCLVEQGHHVIVMAKSPINKYEVIEQEGYEVHFIPVDTKNADGKRVIHKTALTVLNWVKYARKQQPDCISGHDLIPLTIGYLSTLGKRKKARAFLVYDSHEFELGRNTDGKRSNFTTYIISKAEKFLMKKSAFSIMVNDSIANEVQRIHKLKERPAVVRNIPNYWNVDNNICAKRREEICARLSVSNGTFIVMYHGGITPVRGIETLLASVQRNENIVAVILGYGEMFYVEQLKKMAEQLKISDRVLFHDAVPLDVLWQYVGAVDVGLITVPSVNKNDYYMLPNKFFENIQALTPIICSDFPEVATVVNKYNIGLLVNPENVEEIVNAVEKMRTDKDLYYTLKSNLKQAKEELCWENERIILEKAYAKILQKID